jgi:hypothetical protein
MCPIDLHPFNDVMTDNDFFQIANSLGRYTEFVKMITITGLGEPFLDKGLFRKTKYLVSLGFESVAVITNGMQLNQRNRKSILETGVNILFVSLDGLSPETQDVIRKGSNVFKLISYIESLLEEREKIGSKVKVGIRFTCQDINRSEWQSFSDFWAARLDFVKGDLLLKYDVHNHNENIDYSSITGGGAESVAMYCSELEYRMTIRANGTLSLCCGDHTSGKYVCGSVLESDPMQLYNSGHFLEIRENLASGNKKLLPLCSKCTIPDSIASRCG